MNTHDYTVDVKGPGLEVSRPVDEVTALSVISVILGGKEEPAGGATETARSGFGSNETTVGEFLATLNVPNNTEKIAGILLYAREHLDQARLPARELPAWFQRAGESPPTNPSRDVRKAVSKRLIAEDPTHEGEFFVTQTGIDALRSSPSGKARRASRPSTVSRTGHGPSQSGDDDATSKEFSPSRRRARSATAAGAGPTERIRTLIAASWLNEPRTTREIVDELERRGASYKRTDLTRQLQTLTREGELEREKLTPSGGKRQIWHYSVPK